ncbi:MAG: hypothetical protein ABII90_06300 [Bacteroidota bacterium]
MSNKQIIKRQTICCAFFPILLMFCITQIKAQSFDKGTNALNAGVGFGGVYINLSKGYSALPSFSFLYEKCIISDIGPGTFGVGGMIAQKSIKYDRTSFIYHYNESWSYLIIGARGSYHFNFTGIRDFDPYAGIMFAYYIPSYNMSTNDPFHTAMNYSNYPVFSPYAGVRYYFNKTIGVYGEFCYGYSFGVIGLSAKF